MVVVVVVVVMRGEDGEDGGVKRWVGPVWDDGIQLLSISTLSGNKLASIRMTWHESPKRTSGVVFATTGQR